MRILCHKFPAEGYSDCGVCNQRQVASVLHSAPRCWLSRPDTRRARGRHRTVQRHAARPPPQHRRISLRPRPRRLAHHPHRRRPARHPCRSRSPFRPPPSGWTPTTPGCRTSGPPPPAPVLSSCAAPSTTRTRPPARSPAQSPPTTCLTRRSTSPAATAAPPPAPAAPKPTGATFDAGRADLPAHVRRASVS
jgi:hypothetical protein